MKIGFPTTKPDNQWDMNDSPYARNVKLLHINRELKEVEHTKRDLTNTPKAKTTSNKRKTTNGETTDALRSFSTETCLQDTLSA